MSTVISFTNQKGGVGKTTFSTQLAYYLATTKKKKVLFIDMDAQEDKTLLMDTLRAAVRPDPVKTTVIDMTPLNLVEMTRKKEKRPLWEQIAQVQKLNNQSLDAAKIVIAMIPVLAVYPFLQKYFVSGITLGSVKG